MQLGKTIASALLLLPLAEVVAFILVAMTIGLGSALLLTLLTSVAGALILRAVGRSHLRQFRSTVAQRIEISSEFDGAAFFKVLAGLLLLVPGFITDLLGLMLLLPPARRALGNSIVGAVRRRAEAASDIVDLAPDQWRRHPQANLPRRDQNSPPDH